MHAQTFLQIRGTAEQILDTCTATCVPTQKKQLLRKSNAKAILHAPLKWQYQHCIRQTGRCVSPEIVMLYWYAGEQVHVLSSLTCLTEVNMKGCYRVGDQGLSHLAALHHLRRLNLQGCWQITALGLAHLTGMLHGLHRCSHRHCLHHCEHHHHCSRHGQ
jgi:hypothetical protein